MAVAIATVVVVTLDATSLKTTFCNLRVGC